MDDPDAPAPDRVEVPISALEHWSYCPRQCALIHVEQTYDENVFTIRGTLAHERVDSGTVGSARGVKVVRSIPLWSERLGLFGRADAVEFPRAGPYPVEYKVGRRHGVHADLQLCAQALCLEEMLGVTVPEGATYHAAERRRYPVPFTPELRERTEAAIVAVRVLLRGQILPAAPNDARCRSCSLLDVCMPDVVSAPGRTRVWLSALFTPLPLAGGNEEDAADA